MFRGARGMLPGHSLPDRGRGRAIGVHRHRPGGIVTIVYARGSVARSPGVPWVMKGGHDPPHAATPVSPFHQCLALGTPAATDQLSRLSYSPRPGSRFVSIPVVTEADKGSLMEQAVDAEVVKQTIDVEVVEERNADAYGFTVKVLANGLLHRILPVRDPNQPRFWCVVVFRCSPGGIPDESERPWVGLGGLRREDLKETMSAIRADPSSWLAETAHGKLRDWMLEPGLTPAPTTLKSASPVATTHPSGK